MAESLIREAREAFEEAINVDKDNRDQAEADLRFMVGKQWPDAAERQRAIDGRPVMTFSRLQQIERRITGDMRLNPPSIKVRPVDDGADPETAKTLTGLIRNIEAQSNANRAYLTAATNAVRCGEGWFGLKYDYVADGFDMEFQFRRFSRALAVVPDPNAEEPTASDAEWMFVPTLVHNLKFKEMYPEASMAGWDEGSTWGTWKAGEFVRVAEWWRKVTVQKTIAMLEGGAVVDITDLEGAALDRATQGRQVLKTRKTDGYRVEMRLMNGVEELEEVHHWPGCMIPLFRVIGDEVNIDGKVTRFGIVRMARDAQALYNIQRTAMAEAVAMAPKAKWLVTPEMVAGQEAAWGSANVSNAAYLLWTPDSAAPGLVPQRVAPDMPNGALVADVQAAAMDIEATTGVYRENLGQETNAVSGKAILSRQREGDTGTFLFADNLADSVGQAGRALIDAVPKVYDTQRVLRTLGEDGTEEFVAINQQVVDPRTGRIVIVNDLSVGRYDVVSSVGPSFSTKREEGRETLMALMQASPQVATVGADLIAAMIDAPGVEELATRLRRMAVAQGFAEPKEGDQPPAPPQPGADVLLAQAEMAKAQANMAKVQADASAKAQELKLREMELLIEARKIGADITVADGKLKLQQIETAAKVAGQIATHHAGRQDRHQDRADGLRARQEDRLQRGMQ